MPTLTGMREVGVTVQDFTQLAVGMSILAGVFVVAQSLLFVEELWWRP